MKLLGNIIWFLAVGVWTSLTYVFIGVLLCITIIGIPFGKQCFKMAGLVLTPFGNEVDSNFAKHPIANIIWFLIAGWELAIGYCLVGAVLCITIIGIPFGKQCFKLAMLSLFPFGAEVK